MGRLGPAALTLIILTVILGGCSHSAGDPQDGDPQFPDPVAAGEEGILEGDGKAALVGKDPEKPIQDEGFVGSVPSDSVDIKELVARLSEIDALPFEVGRAFDTSQPLDKPSLAMYFQEGYTTDVAMAWAEFHTYEDKGEIWWRGAGAELSLIKNASSVSLVDSGQDTAILRAHFLPGTAGGMSWGEYYLFYFLLKEDGKWKIEGFAVEDLNP